ncbi:tetratricopeptide repeat protein [Paenibacillus piri]|uniref:Tetratricopeptide repeat protein n=1 Tax=Paenibacillus piri TaxID=2547395 RepID=A0A4R5KSN5_9BACL|nr:tetratricopeptide repeat protein [Paenibacillus piri]TDF98811.1 tetratricopeptide repeat protein [Paenibacillus piri]
MKPWLKILLQIGVPVVILIILFKLGPWYGWAGVAVLAAFVIYWLRGNYFAFQANVRYNKKDLRAAADYYGRAYKTNRNPGMAVSQAFVLLKLGENEAAESLLEQVMQRKLSRSSEINAKINYSIALWKRGKRAEAIGLMEAIVPNFKNSVVYGNLGLFYLMSNDLDKALAHNLEAYDYNDTDNTILDNLALNYYLLGRYEEAKEIYDKLMEQNPTFAEAYYYYAMTLAQLDEQDAAVKALEQGLSYEPSMITDVTKAMLEAKLREWRPAAAEE